MRFDDVLFFFEVADCNVVQAEKEDALLHEVLGSHAVKIPWFSAGRLRDEATIMQNMVCV